VRRLLTVLPAVAAVVALAACGNSPTPPLGNPLSPAPVARLIPERFPKAGLDIEMPDVPNRWLIAVTPPPLVVGAVSGTAAISVWRYPRGGKLPRTRHELALARRALVADERARDPGFDLRSARVIRAAGFPAIELLARETIAGQLRAVRSTHVYAHGNEYVIDELAPPASFDSLDREVFLPVIATLHLPRPR
jgi:hypothetical protein